MSGSGSGVRSFTIDGHVVAAKPLPAALYVVATPIGNLGDTTIRALATLAAADIVACEDTRVTSVLFRHFGIATRLMPYHDHNAALQRPKILAALAEGKVVALVSDAGTPLVSDPGYRLVGEVQAAGYDVVPIPGASAVLAALVASGLPTDSFLFAGFLPPKTTARRKRLAELGAVPATLVFFESPQRIAATLADMSAELGRRDAVVARELTKTFEQVRRGPLADLAVAYAEEPTPKGEIVVVVSPPEEEATSAIEADRILISLLEEKSVSVAAAEAAEITGLPRRELYQRALALKDGRGK
jgi:16S rRNA (cytidine1402-2'-O)-methyltransferase